MGYAVQFGPPKDDLSPGDVVEHPGDWEAWTGSRRLEPTELRALVKLVNDAGFPSVDGAGMVWFEGNFESLCLHAGGGWLSKPAVVDPSKFAELWAVLVRLCDAAGWFIYDPQSFAIIHAPGFVLPELVTPADLVAEAIATLRLGHGELLIERAPEPTVARSSKPSVTAEQEFVNACVLFAGPKLVVAKTPNGNNVTLKLADSGLSKGDTVRVNIAPSGQPREVELCSDDSPPRRVLL